jgi:hypothetical protein
MSCKKIFLPVMLGMAAILGCQKNNQEITLVNDRPLAPEGKSGNMVLAGNTTVNFTQAITYSGVKAAYPFSGTISTYGSTSIAQPGGAIQSARLTNLKLGLYRVPIKWNGGNVISSAVGGPTNISGLAWITAIKNTGSEPMVVIGGAANDNDITPADAANLVNYFKNNGMPVKYWVVGNEPGMTMDEYCAMFNAVFDAMKNADTSIKIGGPALAWFNMDGLRRFIQLSGNKADFIDYHHYAMGVSFLSDEQALSETVNWENEIKEIRAMIASELPGAESRIEIQVGEYNWSWRTGNGYPGWNGDDRFYNSIATVWAASVAGHIAKAGGRGHQYADLNGALGLTFEKASDASNFGRSVNDAMPVYYGLQMFSGGNLFRAFGSPANASTTLSNVEVYASTNKNIVMVNKDLSASQTVSVDAIGIPNGAVIDVWQTNNAQPFTAPQKVGSIVASNGWFSYNLPAKTVTTFIVTTSTSQNLALTSMVTASGYVNAAESPDKAKDGNTTTSKWCDNMNHDKWLQYDFGSGRTIKKIVLNWEDWDKNTKYKIQTSNDGNNWTDCIVETINDADPRSYDVNLSNIRYVRFFVAQSDDTDAVRLMEFEVWGN